MLEPWPLKYVIDLVVSPATNAALQDVDTRIFGVLVPFSSETLLVVLALIMIGLTGLRALFVYASKSTMAHGAGCIAARLREQLLTHLQTLTLSNHHQFRSGDIVTRATSDVGRFRDVLATALVPLIANLIGTCAILAVMLWLNAELALVAVAIIPLFFVLTLRSSRAIQSATRKQRRTEGKVATNLAESLEAMPVIQAFSLSKRITRATQKGESHHGAVQRLTASLSGNVELIVVIGTALVIWRGAHLVIDGTITLGTLLVFITYLGQVLRPLRQSAVYIAKLGQGIASGERILEIFDAGPGIVQRPGAQELRSPRGAVVFENVDVMFGSRKALDQLSFAIKAGERVALVGPSGSGKSTVLSILLRLQEFQGGRVTLDDIDLRDIQLDSLRRNISVVLQESMLLAGTIRDNICLGRPDALDEDIVAAARTANIHDYIMDLPKGYNTLVGERGTTLSGGERQRISLARAVMRNAAILLLDEPTTGLDGISRQAVLAALAECSRGKTTLMVTHELTSLGLFDRIIYIAHGRVVEIGTYQELMRRQGLFWRMSQAHSAA